MSVYNKRGILLLPKVIVLNPKDGHICKSYRRYPRKRYLRYFMKKFEIKLRKA